MPDAEGQPRRKRQRADSQSPHADDGAHDRDPDPGHGRGSADEVSACQSCRRRKLRCSKQQPCQQCERLHVNCTYHHERRRPGFKPGAIEALSQRVANLEQMFLGQALMFQHRLGLGHEGSHVTGISDGRQADLHSSIADIRETYLNAATEACSRPNLVERSGPAQDDAQSHMQNLELCRENGVNHDTDELLPSESILRGLVAWYFENVHRWIPVLHQRRFWEMFNNPEERPRMHIILLSMTSCCLQFERPSDMSLERSKTIITRCRHAVILKSMEHFSVESLQALVILAFNLIGSGQGPRSWGIIGSMVRTAEQLRLDMEPVEEGTSERDQDGYMIRRMTFLPLARTWIEEEERRRVFWCVFMLDRFCSVATGWGNGLVGAGSRRRLPCEGLLWERGTPVDTPFFQAETETHAPTPRGGEESPENDSISNIGGLAFCLEATDTLNLVTKFLLQRAVQFTGSQQVRLWLLKFKELDLRLVKWRLSLPEKWREASVLNQDGIMDPNLTLAHITQNTAVIQLHQCIAFPPASLQACHVALPSASSAETCVSAACEIGTIAQEFLQQSSGIVHPQLAFCLFIAGRVLLVNASHFGTGVLPAFSNICTVLHEVGRRWDHDGTDEPQLLETRNLAFRLSSRLLNAHSAMDPSLLTPNKVTTLDVGRPVCSEYCPRSRAVSEGPTIDAEITQEDHQPAMVGVEGFRAPTMSGEQHRPLLVPTIGEDETQLFTNFNCEQPFWDLIQAASGSVAEKGDTNNEWMNGLDGVFDENFQQMLRVSNYADTGNQSGNSNWFPS